MASFVGNLGDRALPNGNIIRKKRFTTSILEQASDNRLRFLHTGCTINSLVPMTVKATSAGMHIQLLVSLVSRKSTKPVAYNEIETYSG